MHANSIDEDKNSQLIDETMKSVMDAACSFDSDRVTVIDNTGGVRTVENINISTESTDVTEESV